MSTPPPQFQAPVARSAKLTSFATIMPQPRTWLLQDVLGRRIPKGALSVVAGAAGTGKSTWAIAVAAELSRRGDEVLFVGAEDGAEDVLVPRLLAAGGDRSKCHLLTVDAGGREDLPWLPSDVPLIEDATRGKALIVIDTLGGHIEGHINTNSDQSLRQALIPLAQMLRVGNTTAIGVMHQNKAAKDHTPLNSLNGGTAYGGVARSVMILTRRKEEDDQYSNRRVLMHIKSNYSRLQSPLATEIRNVQVGDLADPFSAMDLGNEESGVRWSDLA